MEMKYDLVRTEDQNKLESRLMHSFICLPCNPWSIQRLSHSNIACILSGWYYGTEPYNLKAIPRINGTQENLIEILKHQELIGSIEIPDDIEVVRHVIRMHKVLIEFELDFPDTFRALSDMIYSLGNDEISELADDFISESIDHCQTALVQSRDAWSDFLGEFLNFRPANQMRLSA
jgi:hypothetical protein